MGTSTKRRGEPLTGRASKRQAVPTTTRLTRAAYRKLNEDSETKTALNPGLPIVTRRRQRKKDVSATASATASASQSSEIPPPLVSADTGTSCGQVLSPRTYIKSRGSVAEKPSSPTKADQSKRAGAEAPLEYSQQTIDAPPGLSPNRALNAGGPAPIPYMGGVGVAAPAEWEVCCHEKTAPQLLASNFLKPTKLSSPCETRRLSTCSASTSCVSPRGPPRPFRPADGKFGDMGRADNEAGKFKRGWYMGRGILQLRTGDGQEDVCQGPVGWPVVGASYSLAPEDAAELMGIETAVSQRVDKNLEALAEIGLPLFVEELDDGDFVLTGVDDNLPDTQQHPSEDPQDFDSWSLFSEPMDLVSDEGDAVESLDGTVTTLESSRSTPCLDDDEPGRPSPQKAPGADAVVAAGEPLKMLVRDAAGGIRIVTSDECPSAFPQAPWPYHGRSPSWALEDDQYSVEEQDEDTLIW